MKTKLQLSIKAVQSSKRLEAAQEYTVIRFLYIRSAKFGICTVVGINGTLFEAIIRTWDIQCAYFSFSKRAIQTHDCAKAEFSTF
jgi:hypothetical protein